MAGTAHVTRLTPRGLGLLVAGATLAGLGIAMGHRDIVWPGLFLGILPLLSALIVWTGGRVSPSRRTVTPLEVEAGGTMHGALRVDPSRLGVSSVLTETIPWGPSPRFRLAAHPGRARLALEYATVPPDRGRFHIGPAMWTFTDLFGLATADWAEDVTTQVVVVPRVHPLGPAGAGVGLGLTGGSDRQNSSLPGPEDVLIRDYRPGDDLRRVHWPSAARTGQVMVRLEERAWDPSALILLDNRAGAHTVSGSSSTLEWSVEMAASIGAHLASSGFWVGIADDTGRLFATPERGRERVRAMLVHLAEVPRVPDGTLEAAARACRADSRGHVLIAVTGRLSPADAHALVEAGRDRADRIAFVSTVRADASDGACRVLAGEGWTVVGVAAGTSIPEAWARTRTAALR